jgi:hypothetical protein
MNLPRISKGNMKLGKIPNVSLPPIITCLPGALCKKKCYAMKAWRMYPGCRSAWVENLELWTSRPGLYEIGVMTYLVENKPEYFRWHVSGDIPSFDYYQMMCRLAARHKKTRFMAFTKRGDLLGSYIARAPKNLQIIVSQWPGMPCDYKDGEVRKAWVFDPKYVDVRIPYKRTMLCPGSCSTCKFCFHPSKKDVLFKVH